MPALLQITRWKATWLGGALLLVVANALVLAAPSLELRLAGALLFMFVLPGAALLQAVFDTRHASPVGERAVLAAGASVALFVWIFWLQHLTALGFQLPHALVGLDALMVLLACTACVRRSATRSARLPHPAVTRRDRLTAAGLLIVTGASLLLVLWRLDFGDVVGDELKVVNAASEVLLGKPERLYSLAKGPAQILLTMGVMRLGDSLLEGALRLPFALCGVLSALSLMLLARSRLRWSIMLLAGLLLITQGTLLTMARWIQYQVFVQAMVLLALYCGWRGWSTRFHPVAGRYWLLCALFVGAGLLGHYDTALVGPALLYLFIKSRGSQLARPALGWRAAGLAAVVLLIAAPYYLMVALQPGGLAEAVGGYLGGRVNLSGAPYNNLPHFFNEFWNFESAYRVPVVFALIAVASFAGLSRIREPAKRACCKGALALCMAGIVYGAFNWPGFVIAGFNVTFMPFVLCCALLAFAIRADVFWMAALLLSFTVLSFTGFLMAYPYDHYFLSLSTLVLAASAGAQAGLDALKARMAANRYRRVSRLTTALAVVWLLVVTGYTVLADIAYYPWRSWADPGLNTLIYPQLASGWHKTPAPVISSAGWRAVAVMYQTGDLRGENDTNVERGRDWYLARWWDPPAPAPRYYFMAPPEKPGKPVKDPPPDLTSAYSPWVVLTVEDQPQITIYRRRESSAPPEPRVLKAEAFYDAWRALARFGRLETYKRRQRDDSAFYAIAAMLSSQARDGDGLVIDAPAARQIVNQYYTGTLPYVDLPTGDGILAQRRIWGVFWADSANGLEHALAAQAYPASAKWYNNVRVRLYGVSHPVVLRDSGLRAGGVATLARASTIPADLRPGGLLPIALEWRVEAPTLVPHKLFVHVVNAQGMPLAQADDEPLAGTRPTNAWQPGETITTRIAVWLPADMREGRYAVLAGLYNPSDGARLPVFSRDGAELPNAAMPLGELVIAK